MEIPVRGLGTLGVIKDVSPLLLPPRAWSDALNVRFEHGVVKKGQGHRNIGATQIIPYAIFECPTLDTRVWAYFGLTKAYGFLERTHTDITRLSANYTGNTRNEWLGGMFHGRLVVTNGEDLPQMWATPDLSTPLDDLSNWPSTYRAAVIRGFGNFLQAYGIAISGVEYPRMVKWSHRAESNSLPTSWDYTDSTLDAGENTLAGGETPIIDSLEFADDINVIYTEDELWTQSLVGGAAVFDFRRRFNTIGMLARGCAVNLRDPVFGRRQFVVTQDDIVLHNGIEAVSIAEGAVRDWLFENLSQEAFPVTKVVSNVARREVWVCFPSVGSGVLDMALIWRYGRDPTWTLRELPSGRAVAYTQKDPAAGGTTWREMTLKWSELTQLWADFDRRLHAQSVLVAPLSTDGILMAEGNEFEGVAFRSYVERKGLDVAASDGSPDPRKIKLLRWIRPHVEAAVGTEISVYSGAHDSVSETPTWTGPHRYVVGSDQVVEPQEVSGRFLALRFEDQGAAPWSLLGYDLDVAILGEF